MIADLHNDVLTAKPRRLKKVKAEGGDKTVFAVWTTKLRNPAAVLSKVKSLTRYRAIEDLGFIINPTLPLIKEFDPVYASLTWNNENPLAGGAYSDAGLTPFGISVIEYLERHGITFDTAHLNERSFYDAMRYTDKPVICSHTCFKGVFNHPRNLSYGQIKVIKDCGGIAGLALVPEFMGKKRAGIEDVIRQIDYYCGLFGVEGLAIGTDFYGAKNPALKNYDDFKALKIELIKRGYKLEQVERIFYANAAEFLKKAMNNKK